MVQSNHHQLRLVLLEHKLQAALGSQQSAFSDQMDHCTHPAVLAVIKKIFVLSTVEIYENIIMVMSYT